LIAVKTTSNGELSGLLGPVVGPGTALVTLQNGLGNEDALAALFPSNPVLGGIAFTCINRVYDSPAVEGARGHAGLTVDHTSHGLIRLGAFGPPATGDSHLAAISALFQRSRIRCEAIPDLMHGRWRKLVWNVPFNGLGAALDLATDQVLASEAGARLVARLMQEVMAASAAVGLPFADPEGIVEHQLSETRGMARYRTSMQLDRRHGRPLEHEAIIGQPLRRGIAAGVAMPETARLYEELRVVNASLERG
jgi:2-dehydropantoate 2-reductase